MYTLSERAKRKIEQITGLPFSELNKITLTNEKKLVESKKSQGLKFSREKRNAIAGRGNPLLARKKIRTIEEVDEYLANI